METAGRVMSDVWRVRQETRGAPVAARVGQTSHGA